VGKTSIVTKYVNNQFSPLTPATIGASFNIKSVYVFLNQWRRWQMRCCKITHVFLLLSLSRQHDWKVEGAIATVGYGWPREVSEHGTRDERRYRVVSKFARSDRNIPIHCARRLISTGAHVL
jgi:GTPase SAR1 family protein